MDGIDSDGTVTAELYVRSALPGPSQRRADAVAAELRGLVGEGLVEDVEHTTWSKRVRVDGCDSAVRDVYLTWTAWARREGVQLQPFFDTRECYCPEAEAYTDWLVVPAIALAVSVDGDLAAVYPHEDGTETVSVEDGIDALEGTERQSTDPPVSVAD